MIRSFPGIGAAAALLVGFAAAVPAADDAPVRPQARVEESVGVSLVEVPVTVVDGSGRALGGLTRDDFEVFDDGKRVAIESLDESDFPGFSPTAPPDPKTRPRVPRTFLLLYDLAGVTPAELERSRTAGRSFVREQMGPADVAGVATISPGGDVRLLQNLARDRERLLAAFDGIKPVQDRGRDMVGPIPSAGDKFTAEEIEHLKEPGRAQQAVWVERLLDALEAVASGLQPVPGRKQVILFSHGFDLMLDERRLVNDVDKVVTRFRMEDCVLNAVNVAALGATGANGEALFTLANDTGGRLLENSNDLSGQIGRILEANRVVYALTFKTTLTGHPGRFHALQVRVHAPGTKVFARAGYVEPRPI